MVKRLLVLIVALVLIAAACGDDDEAVTEGRLQQVIDRGTLSCGVNDTVTGFGFVEADGSFSGFDVEFCRVVAAAVLGDANAVEFTPLTTAQRFTSLQAGEIDVLIRNTTWTASRDGTEGATFLHTTFYDGQGMMVRSDSGFTTMEDMTNTTICVLSGTTTELNLTARFANIVGFTPLTFESADELRPAFVAGQCDGWTSDKSQLASFKPGLEDEGIAVTILEETFSKEPLGPVVADGDSQWAQVVDWAVLATIQAEEFGITSGNIGTFAGTDDGSIARFLGQTEDDPGLGLPRDFATQIISQVGNYAEIYERNIGPNTPLGLVRGVNALWTDGGLLYAPPFR
ncbi:MAG: amino acid ABC transporter substrate-binding protein [Acidimicrobiia bacterium]